MSEATKNWKRVYFYGSDIFCLTKDNFLFSNHLKNGRAATSHFLIKKKYMLVGGGGSFTHLFLELKMWLWLTKMFFVWV